ncbi:Ataxin-3 [Chamberlinius hualienensis]
MDAIDVIFHEKQEGSLCAQHCLNALLQGEYFTAVDLASIAQTLDDEEENRMAEGGINSESYKNFLEQPSTNMDDSGYFSVQVIVSALKVWNLEVIPYQSQSSAAVQARTDPVSQSAFICNYKDHWFAIRKIGRQWFNLNSLLTSPELISDTYLRMFLAQLEQEGYAIFVIIGDLPESEADNLLRHVLAVQNVRPKLLFEENRTKGDLEKPVQVYQEDKDLQEALRLSLIENEKPETSTELKLTGSTSSRIVEARVLDERGGGSDMTEEEMLEAALKMSMEEL